MKHLDKFHHFFWTFGLAVLAGFFLDPVRGVIVAALLGLAKEIWDGMAPRNRFDWWDLAANAAGLIAAWVVTS